MIRLRPGSTLRFRGTWWQSRAKTARVDLTGVVLDIVETTLPFAVTIAPIAQPAAQDFEVFAADTQTALAEPGAIGSFTIRATFANGDRLVFPETGVTFA